MTQSTNRFLQQIESNVEAASEPIPSSSQPTSNRFLEQMQGMAPEPEGAFKSAARTAVQPALGYLQKYTWPLNLLLMAGQGEALADDFDEARVAELKEKFPQFPWENLEGFKHEDYLQAIQDVGETFPTQQNVEKLIEHYTGIPLEPKTKLQKATRLGSTAAFLRPGGFGQKATAGVTAPVVSESLQAAGAPEFVGETVGLIASGKAPSVKTTTKTKPSGVPERRFENLKKPTEVTPKRYEAIKSSVEGDFKKVADDLLSKNKTYSAMKEDNIFKERVTGLFEDVEKFAEEIPGNIHTEDLRTAFAKRYNNRESKGISPNEYERGFKKEIKKLNQEIPYKDLTAPQLVEQFRKNNQSLKEYFEPGKSSAFNRAKRDALLEYNRAIEDVIAKKYPDSEFKNLFEFTNKRWSEISDIEQIDDFMNKLFEGKINYKEAKNILNKDKEYVSRPFKRVLGEEGYKDFKTLTNDLLTTEKAMSLIKKAEVQGFTDFAKTAGAFLIHPSLAKAQLTAKYGKQVYQILLDKPKLLVTWEKALQDAKKGNFADAERAFIGLDKALSQSDSKANPEKAKQ